MWYHFQFINIYLLKVNIYHILIYPNLMLFTHELIHMLMQVCYSMQVIKVVQHPVLMPADMEMDTRYTTITTSLSDIVTFIVYKPRLYSRRKYGSRFYSICITTTNTNLCIMVDFYIIQLI